MKNQQKTTHFRNTIEKNRIKNQKPPGAFLQESLLFFYVPPPKNVASFTDTTAIKLNQSKHTCIELQGSTKPGGGKPHR